MVALIFISEEKVRIAPKPSGAEGNTRGRQESDWADLCNVREVSIGHYHTILHFTGLARCQPHQLSC